MSTDNSDRGEGYAVHAALTVQSGLLIVTLPLDDERFPDISDIFPAANRMQRAAHDLNGVSAENAADSRKWLRHAAWPAQTFPLRKSFDAKQTYSNGEDDYPFVQVRG
ncbi:MAG TPA: NADH-quinone oxidoreductase subunit C, partial [Burkholderiales bacterium]|nr:NADH-quinone oxidoreductase subunit C [Burkholderiales bacterium]